MGTCAYHTHTHVYVLITGQCTMKTVDWGSNAHYRLFKCISCYFPWTPTTDQVRVLPMDRSTDYPYGPPLRTTHQNIIKIINV